MGRPCGQGHLLIVDRRGRASLERTVRARMHKSDRPQSPCHVFGSHGHWIIALGVVVCTIGVQRGHFVLDTKKFCQAE